MASSTPDEPCRRHDRRGPRGRKCPPWQSGVMDRVQVRELLSRVAAGAMDVDAAVKALVAEPFQNLGFARLDTHRALRTGDPEVVYAEGKTAQQVVELLATLREAHPGRPAIATRLVDGAADGVREAFANATIDPIARAAAIGPLPDPAGTVCVIAAGTSDAPVAAEAAFVARAFGAGVTRIDDVGVAG